MGKINASLSTVSTEFEPLPPAIYDFEIEKIEEFKKQGQNEVTGYIVVNKVISTDQKGRQFRDFINVIDNSGKVNEIGLANLKKYFECIFGIDEVSGVKNGAGQREGGWSDDDFDTDKLQNKRWRGQIEVKSRTVPGETTPRLNNRIVEMEPLG